ncbi:MAG: hypothetical protein ACLQBB_13815 [Solirubrobacteraceae bacterium]
MGSIPDHVLLACGRLGERIPAASAASALAAGLLECGRPAPDVCLLPEGDRSGGELGALLDGLGFDERMLSARAVVVAVARLQERALAGTVTFEIATRARQAGVPCYAVTAQDGLDRFDARLLDLQLVLEAGSRRALLEAGRRLARIA